MFPHFNYESESISGSFDGMDASNLNGEGMNGLYRYQGVGAESSLVVTPEWLNNATVQDITNWIFHEPSTVGKVCACFQSWVQGASLNADQLRAAKKILESSRFALCQADAYEPVFAILEAHLTSSTDADLQEFLKVKALENSMASRIGLACRFYEVLSHTNALSQRTPLHYAAEVGDQLAVGFFLSTSTEREILSVDADGFAPLHLAVKNGHMQIVEAILEKMDQLKITHPPEPYPDYTDLISACLLGDSNAVACFILLSKQYEAMGRPLNKLIMMLKGYSPKEKSLAHMAIEANQMTIACQLMAPGFDPTVADRQGRRPLELLVETCDLSVLGDLEDALACWKPADWTVMEAACTWGINKLALALIQNAALPDGDPMEVVANGSEALAQQLLKAQKYSRLLMSREGTSLFDAIPDTQREAMSVGLLEAINKKEGEFIALMAMHGMPPELQCTYLNKLGNTFLAASLRDHRNINMFRLDDNAFLDVVQRYKYLHKGVLPLDYELCEAIKHVINAAARQRVSISPMDCIFSKIELLIRNGAPADRGFKHLMEIPFQPLAAKEMILILHLLLEHGIDVNTRTQNGGTWLHGIVFYMIYQSNSQTKMGDVISLWSLLIRSGARIDIPDTAGNTTFDLLLYAIKSTGQSPLDSHWKKSSCEQLINLALQGCKSRGMPYLLRLMGHKLNFLHTGIAENVFKAFVDRLEYASCPMVDLVGPGKVAPEHENLTFAEYVRSLYPNMNFYDYWIKANRGASMLIRSEGDQGFPFSNRRFAWSDFLSDEQAAISRLEEMCSTTPPPELMTCVDEHNNTLLHKACELGYVDFACRLLRQYPQWDLEGRNERALTPLMVLLQNHPEKGAPFVREAADKGALLDVHTPHGCTLLNNLIKSYSEVADNSPPSVKAGIEATFTTMLSCGARPFVSDWQIGQNAWLNCAGCACFKHGIDKTRPLFKIVFRPKNVGALWFYLNFMLSTQNRNPDESKHRLNMASLIVKEAALPEIDTPHCKAVKEKLKVFEAERAFQAMDRRDRQDFVTLRNRCTAFMGGDSIEKYGFVIDEVAPEGIKGRYLCAKTNQIETCAIDADVGSLYLFYCQHCFDNVVVAVKKLRSDSAEVEAFFGNETSIISGKVISRSITVSIGSIAKKEVYLDLLKPSLFRESLNVAVRGLEDDLNTYALKVREVEQFFELSQKSKTLFVLREPLSSVSRSFSPGPCKIAIYQVDGTALFFDGRFVGAKQKRMKWSTVKETIRNPLYRPQVLVGISKSAAMPFGHFKERWESFLQEAPFKALNESKWKVPEAFKDSIAEWAPHLSPFVSQLETVHCGTNGIEYSKVDINKGSLSVTLRSHDGSRVVFLNNIPFWALIDRVSLYNHWPMQVQADNITMGDAGFTLTEVPHVELVVEDVPQVNIDDLLMKFDRCPFEKEDSMRKGIIELTKKIKGVVRVTGDNGDAGAADLREAQKRLKKLIHVFDALSEADKAPILSELGRIGNLCLPEINKGLKDILVRWVYHTPTVPSRGNSTHLAARSLDMARRKAWYDQLRRAYGSVVPDTHVLTHFANMLTSDPHPIQLPADLTAHVNRGDYFNEGFALQILGSKEDVKTRFVNDTIYHVLMTFIEQFEEMSLSKKEADQSAMSSIMSDLGEIAVERGTDAERGQILQLVGWQQQEALAKADELEWRQAEVDRVRTLERFALTDYTRAKESLAAILKLMSRPDDQPQSVQLGKKRSADDQSNSSTSRRRLISEDPEQEILYMESAGGNEWPEVISALEAKVARLESSLNWVFELEKAAEIVKTEYQSMLASHEDKLKKAKEKLMEARGWVKYDFDVAEQVAALAPTLSASVGAYPMMTLSYEAAIALLRRKGIIRTEA